MATTICGVKTKRGVCRNPTNPTKNTKCYLHQAQSAAEVVVGANDNAAPTLYVPRYAKVISTPNTITDTDIGGWYNADNPQAPPISMAELTDFEAGEEANEAIEEAVDADAAPGAQRVLFNREEPTQHNQVIRGVAGANQNQPANNQPANNQAANNQAANRYRFQNVWRTRRTAIEARQLRLYTAARAQDQNRAAVRAPVLVPGPGPEPEPVQSRALGIQNQTHPTVIRPLPLASDGTATCICCADSHLPADMIICTSAQCSHASCVDCVRGYISANLTNHKVGLSCMGNATDHCGGTLSIYDCKRCLQDAEWVQFREVQERATVSQLAATVPNYYACPGCRKYGCVISPPTTTLLCPRCDQIWCIECQSTHNGGADCFTFDSPETITYEDIYHRLSFLITKQSGQSCPKCLVRAVKTQGCNKMTCVCETKYCYICGVDVTVEQYSHFGASLNKCALYDTPPFIGQNGNINGEIDSDGDSDDDDNENKKTKAPVATKFTLSESRRVNELIGKLFARNAGHPRVNSIIMSVLFELLPDEINRGAIHVAVL